MYWVGSYPAPCPCNDLYCNCASACALHSTGAMSANQPKFDSQGCLDARPRALSAFSLSRTLQCWLTPAAFLGLPRATALAAHHSCATAAMAAAPTTPGRTGLLSSEGASQDILRALRAFSISMADESIADAASVPELVQSLEDGSVLLRAARHLAQLHGIRKSHGRTLSRTPNKVPRAQNFIECVVTPQSPALVPRARHVSPEPGVHNFRNGFRRFSQACQELGMPGDMIPNAVVVQEKNTVKLAAALRWMHENLREKDPSVSVDSASTLAPLALLTQLSQPPAIRPPLSQHAQHQSKL